MDKERSAGGTNIQVTALHTIINVNSLFTLAVFIGFGFDSVFLGLAGNPLDPNTSLISEPSCVLATKYAEDLVAFHVYSFSSFLFSSLIALALKQAIRIVINPGFHFLYPDLFAKVNRSALRVGMLILGAVSACGCAFLMMALVNVVQIKLGNLGCGSSHSYAAVVPLVILVPFGLLLYISVVVYAFTR